MSKYTNNMGHEDRQSTFKFSGRQGNEMKVHKTGPTVHIHVYTYHGCCTILLRPLVQGTSCM